MIRINTKIKSFIANHTSNQSKSFSSKFVNSFFSFANRRRLRSVSSDADNVRLTSVCIILHSLIWHVLLLLLLLLLLRNASDLRNCTSYFGACMLVWYCRPPIGAHFHPTPQPPPVPQQLGETLKIGPWIGNFQPKWWNTHKLARFWATYVIAFLRHWANAYTWAMGWPTSF